MMKQAIALLALLVLLSLQAAFAASPSCSDIRVDASDISMERDEAGYFYFPVYMIRERGFQYLRQWLTGLLATLK